MSGASKEWLPGSDSLYPHFWLLGVISKWPYFYIAISVLFGNLGFTQKIYCKVQDVVLKG